MATPRAITPPARTPPGKQGRGVAEGAAGWFDGLIGPGKAVDTDKYFVISVNALGSAHGSSGPNTIDPRTKKPYGPTFPEITMRDMVASQKLLVDSFGITGLVAVVGPSMGGFQSFQWAASYPGFMKGIAASVTAPRAPNRLGRPRGAAEAAGERSQLERRLVLRERRHHEVLSRSATTRC